MKRVPAADWAATVPWSGISNKPANVGQAVDLSAVTWANVPASRFPVWNGTTFVPTTLPGSSGGGGGDDGTTILDGAEPAIAVRRRPPGQPVDQFQNVWARYEYNVKLYGATGDGGTIDSDAINLAINDLEAAGGGTLYFPAGLYLCPNLQEISAPCRIRGDGIGVTNFDPNGGACFIFAGTSNAFSADNLSVSDCSVAFDVLSGSIYARDIAASVTSHGFRLGEDAAVGGEITGVYLYSAGTALAVGGSATRLTVGDLYALGSVGAWSYGVDLTDGGENSIHDCYFSNVANNAIRLSASVSDTRIHNITCTGVAGSQLVNDLGTNNYVNELYGVGGNTDSRFEDRKEVVADFVWAPGSIPSGYGYYDDFAMPGIGVGDQFVVGPGLALTESLVVQARAQASDLARIIVMNVGTASVNLSSSQWRLRAFN